MCRCCRILLLFWRQNIVYRSGCAKQSILYRQYSRANIRLCMDTLDTSQYNDWDDTRIVLLILAITWCLLHDVGEDAVTFLSLWNRRMSIETLSTHLKRYFGMS